MEKKMKIAITGGKGGTGKSTFAVSFAVELARKNRVMLVDADAECPNDHLILSAKRKKFSSVFSLIPKWDLDKCTMCGKCASVCKQNAIVFVKNKYPAFVPDVCIGCQRIQEFPTGKYCVSFPEPAVKWRVGTCNMATHIKAEAKAAEKINPLKASKRGGL